MIKNLRDARLTDAIPRMLAEQDWVQALSAALGILHERTLRYIDASQIYTDIEHVTEQVLDILAVSWKVDWYDTDYDLEKKRRIIKTALTVRRLMGTVGAVKLQINEIYRDATLEEWFDYQGWPGTFRIIADVTQTTPDRPEIAYSVDEAEKRLVTAKRMSSRLDIVIFRVKHQLEVKISVTSWCYTAPQCGQIRCGTWWTPASVGASVKSGMQIVDKDTAEAFLFVPHISGQIRCGLKT